LSVTSCILSFFLFYSPLLHQVITSRFFWSVSNLVLWAVASSANQPAVCWPPLNSEVYARCIGSLNCISLHPSTADFRVTPHTPRNNYPLSQNPKGTSSPCLEQTSAKSQAWRIHRDPQSAHVTHLKDEYSETGSIQCTSYCTLPPTEGSFNCNWRCQELQSLQKAMLHAPQHCRQENPFLYH